MIHLGVFRFFLAALSWAGSRKHYPPPEAVATGCTGLQISRSCQFGANEPLILSVIRFANLVTSESKSRRITGRSWVVDIR
jgi:hypothetical protein